MLPPTPILRSKAGLAILARTHLEPDREFYLRELVRATGMAPRSIQVQLDRLVEAGVLSERRDGNRRYLRAARGHPLFMPLREIVLKTAGIVPLLREALGSDGISLAFVFGSAASGTSGANSDVDLMVVGSAGVRGVVGRLRQAQKQLGRDINPVVWTRKEWADRLRRRDHFLFRVLANPRLMIVGTENDAEGLAE
jgi:DNA-binding transcriptional ArsR family regulator